MSNLKVYKVKENGWSVLLESGSFVIYPGDILFFEESGVIMKSNAPVFVPCYKLTRMYYNFPEFDPNKSDAERSIIKKLGIETRMVWLNDINLNSPNFSYSSNSWYSINDVLEGAEKWGNGRNGGLLINKLMSNLLEDITIQWGRENKLEVIGI